MPARNTPRRLTWKGSDAVAAQGGLCEHLLFCLSGGVPAGRLLHCTQGAAAGGLSVSIPLGCGFGVSLLAFVPACFAVVLGFRLPALLLAAAVVAALAVWLARHGTPFTRVPDPDAAALWACVLPLAVVTLYLLHTHVLHLVDGSYHTGQSCYGDMAMHLGFIKNIAVTGKLPPVYPLLGGEHRFGYPFLCETVSSVFLVLGQTPAPLTCCPCWPHSSACTA